MLSTSKDDHALLSTLRWRSSPSVSRIRVELIRRLGCLGLARTAQGHLVAAGYRSRHPDGCHFSSSLPPPYVGKQTQSWNHQHWSHAIFHNESRVSLYHSGHHARGFHLFLACNNALVFQQYDEKLGHAHCGCRGWLWTHQQIAQETSAERSCFGACVPTCGRGDGGRVSLEHQSGCLERYPAATKRPWTILTTTGRPVRLIISPWFWKLTENSRLRIRRKARSYFCVFIFSRYPRSPWIRLLLSRTRRRTLQIATWKTQVQ